jgi:hypothetical protein
MTDATASELLSLARQLDRLAPSHRDPHRFHEVKSEIAHRLRVLASSTDTCNLRMGKGLQGRQSAAAGPGRAQERAVIL